MESWYYMSFLCIKKTFELSKENLDDFCYFEWKIATICKKSDLHSFEWQINL